MGDERFRILMIDDSETVLSRAAEALTKGGFEVFTTTQTYAADRFVKEVDLVIVDYHMPGIGGGDLVAALRKACDGVNPKCRFYLNTVDKAVAKKFAELGFDGAFAKKGDHAALVSDVRNIARMNAVRGLRGKKPSA